MARVAARADFLGCAGVSPARFRALPGGVCAGGYARAPGKSAPAARAIPKG